MGKTPSPTEIATLLQDAFNQQDLSAALHLNYPMCEATTFAIGGPADVLVEPSSEAAIIAIAQTCKENDIPLRVLGFGSNILVADTGLRGVVMRFTESFTDVSVDTTDMTITAQAGASNAHVSEQACAAGLSGYEFACGIPGSIGGAALMNAGAYGGDFSSVGKTVRCLTPSCEIIELTNKEAQWSYRHSAMQDNQYLIVSATLQLHPDNPSDIQARIDDLTYQRTSKQPLEAPSAGSTFKRPEGYFVGQLIEEAGLKGYRIGGAQVSEKHTGFVVNKDNASAQDVCDLIAHIQTVIKEKNNVELHPEVRFWGFED